jgi:hypothetical protein
MTEDEFMTIAIATAIALPPHYEAGQRLSVALPHRGSLEVFQSFSIPSSR